ncbi:MAG: helix-turn-helix domain-containing protein [Chthoniobacterales bacterium]
MPTATAHLRLRYLYGTVVAYRQGDELAPRVLEDYEIVLMLEGTASYRADGKMHKVPPGGIILARPGFREKYTWDVHRRTRHAYLHFDFAAPMMKHLLGRVASRKGGGWPSLRAGPAEEAFLAVLLRVLVEPHRGAGLLGPELPEQVQAGLAAMRGVLETDPCRPVSLDELAARASVTGKHLCRLFRASLGHPPLATFRLLKLQLAMALLGRSDLSVKEIAVRCGFDNPLYFTRIFSRVYGAPPTAVRTRLRRGQAPPRNPLPPEITPRVHW